MTRRNTFFDGNQSPSCVHDFVMTCCPATKPQSADGHLSTSAMRLVPAFVESLHWVGHVHSTHSVMRTTRRIGVSGVACAAVSKVTRPMVLGVALLVPLAMEAALSRADWICKHKRLAFSSDASSLVLYVPLALLRGLRMK